jgi:hypothetical protein
MSYRHATIPSDVDSELSPSYQAGEPVAVTLARAVIVHLAPRIWEPTVFAGPKLRFRRRRGCPHGEHRPRRQHKRHHLTGRRASTARHGRPKPSSAQHRPTGTVRFVFVHMHMNARRLKTSHTSAAKRRQNTPTHRDHTKLSVPSHTVATWTGTPN